MLRQCSARYFVEIHDFQTELDVFEVTGVANFGTQCMCASCWSLLLGQTDNVVLFGYTLSDITNGMKAEL